MTFTIHASKNGQSVTTVRIIPAVAVDKARVLEGLGWQVHVTDSAGHQFGPSDFDRLSSLADEGLGSDSIVSHPGIIFLIEHDLLGKPISTLPDHALAALQARG